MPADRAELEAALGYRFRRPDLLRAALIHRSYLHDVPEGTDESNERLEFLGDAVLGFLVARWLYLRYPGTPEGELTGMRGALVRMGQLCTWGQALALGRYLYLSKGEEAQGGRERPTIVGRAMEAVLGAVYLDGGVRAVDRVLRRLLRTTSDRDVAAVRTADYKSQLQRDTQGRFKTAPRYVVAEMSGPAHERLFAVEAWVGDQVLGRGAGRSKQQAEQDAARAALAAFATMTAAEDAPPPAPAGGAS